MRRQVRVNAEARCDLGRDVRYIACTVSGAAADRWYDAISRTMESLADEAETWPEADEAERFGINLRFRIHGKKRHVYRILYTYDDETVIIHRVLHAAQDWIADLD